MEGQLIAFGGNQFRSQSLPASCLRAVAHSASSIKRAKTTYLTFADRSVEMPAPRAGIRGTIKFRSESCTGLCSDADAGGAIQTNTH